MSHDATWFRRHLLDWSLRNGYDDRCGGIYSRVAPAGKVLVADKVFWELCEAMLAFCWGDRHWPELGLAARLERTAGFAEEYLYDNVRGGWYGSASREGGIRRSHKGGAWKADYHVVQACSEIHWRLAVPSQA